MNRKPAYTLVVIVFLSILLGCKGSKEIDSATSKPVPQRKITLRVGYIPVADCSQLFVAIEQGFLNSRGLEVKLVSMPGGAKILEALGAGSLDIGFSNVVSLIQAHDAGLPFVALTGGPIEDAEHKEHAILVSKNGRISQLSDLAHSKIALNTRRNIDELMVTLLLKKNNVPLRDIEFVEIPFPRMISTLEKDNVQAAASIEPYVTIGISVGASKVLSYNYVALQPITEISTYVGSRNWIRKNPAIAHNFTEAINEATDFAIHHPDIVRSILAKYTTLESKYIDQISLPGFTNELSEKGLQDFIVRTHELGWIQREFPAKELLSE